MFTFDPKFLLVVALGLGGCGPREPRAPTGAREAAVLTTQAGLVVPRPEGFDLTEDGSRVVFVEHGDLRSPMRISLWRADAAPSLERPQQDGDVHWIQEEAEGGSGGPVHLLHAYKAVDQGFIVLEAEVQQELGSPDFAVPRSLLAAAR